MGDDLLYDNGIPHTALGRSQRVGSKTSGKPRAIIAKFVGHNYNVKFLRCKKQLRETRKDDPNPVFVKEDFTSKRAGWTRWARMWKKEGKLTDFWTRDVVLFTKYKVNKEQVLTLVNCDAEYAKLAKTLDFELTVPKSVYCISTDEDEQLSPTCLYL